MRELVSAFLDDKISRRSFVTRLASLGFSLGAASSILESLTPLAEAQTAGAGGSRAGSLPPGTRMVEGTGGRLLVEQLHAAGVEFIFNCNSSGTYPIFDALVDRPELKVIAVPQEGQMVAIAQGYTLASGRVAFTINGSVGFPNTLNNMYNAWKDRTPLVVGSQREDATVQGGRDAFEEWDDYLGPSAAFTRWRWSVDQPERIPEITRRAFKIACTPPEGPVALAFPTNVLAKRGLRAPVVDRERFILKPEVKPDPKLVEEAAELLLEAKQPILVVGPEVTRSGGRAEVIALAERLSIPVVQGEKLFDDFPTDHPLFRGTIHAASTADLVLNLGAKMPSQNGRISPSARVVHVSIDPDAIGRVIPTDVGIVADAKEAAADLVTALEAAATAERLETIRSERLAQVKPLTDSMRADRERSARERWDLVPLSWERVAGELDRVLDEDAILVPELAENSWLGSGGNTGLAQFTFGPGKKSRIGRTTGSALGWGVGAAIGVKLAQPNRQVVALQGDGGFLFAQAETLWTMARYEVPVIVVVFDNRSYNGPRNKILQQRGRQGETGKDMTCYLGSPDIDFAKVAAGFGVAGEVVEKPDQVAPAFRRAVASTRAGKPYLIDAVVCRTGLGADSTWFPKYSVAAARTKKV